MSRSVVVVGASSGIGLATARAFKELGDTVHAAARRPVVLDGAEVHECDVTDRESVDALAGAVGGLDVLVVAAGTNIPRRRLGELTGESWDRLINTNLTGTWNVVHAFLAPLLEARGTIILIGSVSGSWPDLSGPAYHAAKAGVLALARGIGYEADGRLRVTAILPGVVDTPILENRPEPPGPEQRARMLQADDVAAACVFVAGLPARAYVPELTILPTELQAIGKTA
jgi:NAD(P)-dependent dehydrogenase (short-subunit alcohol dehydrogenase family)